ncbi:MAG: GMC family oxidoreductase [Rhodospirillales bacterium]
MAEPAYDAIVVGSGAGGAAAAYKLVRSGLRVLMVEKGGFLPRDGSTLDIKKVFKDGVFKNKEPWVDGQNQVFYPGEFYNVGGKTKWYGAALLRFSPHEFEADAAHQCLPWPFGYEALKPFYDEAEALLQVNVFANEAGLQALIDRIVQEDAGWRPQSLPLGLKQAILGDPEEAKHFDGFASACGYKSDAEWNLIDPIREDDRLTLTTERRVAGFLGEEGHPERIVGVRYADGGSDLARFVVLAAGAMSSPRLLEDYLQETGLALRLPATAHVGTNFKFHINSALLGFSIFKDEDVLRKTAIFFNDAFPHSTVQCLGWIDGDILGAQLPAAVPKFVANAFGARAVGFFATTEDGSSPNNRIRSGGKDGYPVMDYRLDRIQASLDEHHACVRAFQRVLRQAGMPGVDRYMGMAGTAHAVGTLVTGATAASSACDPDGKVHGMEGLYVGDGSALPRTSRVNPALTIYAWGLRLGDHLARLV